MSGGVERDSARHLNLFLGEQSQPGRQGVAEGLALLGDFEFVELADGSQGILGGSEDFKASKDFEPERVVEVSGAVT